MLDDHPDELERATHTYTGGEPGGSRKRYSYSGFLTATEWQAQESLLVAAQTPSPLLMAPSAPAPLPTQCPSPPSGEPPHGTRLAFSPSSAPEPVERAEDEPPAGGGPSSADDRWGGISDEAMEEACLQLKFPQMQAHNQMQMQRGAGGALSAPPPPPPPAPLATTRRGSSTADPPAVTSHSIVHTAAPSGAMPSATQQIGPWAWVRQPFGNMNAPRRVVLVVELPTPKAQGARQHAMVLTPADGQPIDCVATLQTLEAIHKDNLIMCDPPALAPAPVMLRGPAWKSWSAAVRREWEKAAQLARVQGVLAQYRPGTAKNPHLGSEHLCVQLIACLGGTVAATVSRRKKEAEHNDKVQTNYTELVKPNATAAEQKAAMTLAKNKAAEGTHRERNTKAAMERNALSTEGALLPPHCSRTLTPTHARRRAAPRARVCGTIRQPTWLDSHIDAMPVFLPAAVQSHQMICIDALLGLQTAVNETVQRCHLAEDPQQLTAGLRGAVAVARSALPGDFAPSSEVAAAAFEKLGTRKLPSAPKLQKDVDTFSKLCKEGKELCDAALDEADELAREMDEGHTDVVFDPRALISSLQG